MDKLRSMEVFAAAAEAGSFSACADALGLSAVMVGKHVGQLERHLGVRLLQRSTRRQSLTEAGHLFLEECRQILERVRNAETVAERLHSQPRGRLRVTAPVTLGETAVAEAVSAYLLRYPEVTVELVLDDTFTDLIADGFDAAVRIGALASSDHLVARPLRPYRMAICAAPAYLAQAGHPRTLAELAGHRCLNHLLWPQGMGWPAPEDGAASNASAPLAANNGQALRRAALAGCGVVMQPEVLLAADIAAGLLVPLLEDAMPAPRPVHLLYPRDPRPLPKQTCFVGVMLEKMGA
ncbi:LysR family transcriptional regulator [Cupriavidus basilensis]|uniref:LysR family transcriptional regulator n=1 Tax=Cupriavidus basilensis TaxID=68895 RepID=UPI0020A6660E|nr:LysR family transcriptional regulator [Cupriavidus basilensis]MCP3024631.1 LysR family transcriptional regulator [Cupriavidus basilensis]MDR3384505.1 LysR family transcriptional regulator [Cupriavidus basilensis]